METSSNYQDFKVLKTSWKDGVLSVVFDNPPINILTLDIVKDLQSLIKKLHQDKQTKVVVFTSANPEFFIAHYDVIGGNDELLHKRQAKLSDWFGACADIPRLPQATIAVIEGIVRGAGSEFTLACDMRFAAKGKALLGQMEVSLGLIPGAGGSHRLEHLIGRGRTMEYILSGRDITGEEAERYGWVNRTLETEELHKFVDELATRIAKFPAQAIDSTKRALNAESLPSEVNLIEEQNLFVDLIHHNPETQAIMKGWIDGGAQTYHPLELNLTEEILKVYK